jgi:hypothetical protein
MRLPGTNVPGVITAGTFYQDGKRVFRDVHHPEKTIVIDRHDERYKQSIVEGKRFKSHWLRIIGDKVWRPKVRTQLSATDSRHWVWNLAERLLFPVFGRIRGQK